MAESNTQRGTCDYEGCEHGIETGHALYRVSPKGEPFVGLCEEHYAGEPDEIARTIEQANRRRTA